MLGFLFSVYILGRQKRKNSDAYVDVGILGLLCLFICRKGRDYF